MIVRIVVVMTVLFFALQLWRPKFENPPAMADFEAPSDVKQILRGSCYACHSNETQLAWFDKIVPAYQLVARDVLSGRMVLNFSDLGALPPALVIYSWVSPEENGKAEPGASDPLKQVADSWARGGAVETSRKGPGA